MDTSEQDPMIGRTLRDKWHIDAQLGKGGMATVYEATHRNGMRGAVKVLHPQYAADDALRRRLVREGRVANHIQHPGVVRVLDDDETDEGRAFVVMELLRGKTWKAAWVEAGKMLPPLEVLRTARQVLDILVAAHEAGVVHRDLKPENVFLTDAGEVKLLDFGIARLRETQTDQTQTGAILGTPAFMSPEQAMARWSQVDERSDVFSVGATLWTLVTGRLVHVCDTVPELLVATATRQAEPFATVFEQATPELANVVDRALKFDKAKRFQTAREMRDAVDAAIASLDGSAPRRTVRRRRILPWALAGAAVFAASLGVYSVARPRDPPPLPSPSSSEVESAAPSSPAPTVEATSPSVAAMPSSPGAQVSSSPSASSRAAPAASASAKRRPFDAGAALAAVHAEAERDRFQCSSFAGPRAIQLAVSFFPDGRVASAVTQPFDDGNSMSGLCVIQSVKRAHVAPFDGDVQRVSTTISLNPS